MKPQTEIGKALSIGMTLAGAAAAGNPEARTLIALLAEAERENVSRAKCAPSSGDTDFLIGKVIFDERQQSKLADDILRAASAVPGPDADREGSKGERMRPYGFGRVVPPGTRANRRRGARF